MLPPVGRRERLTEETRAVHKKKLMPRTTKSATKQKSASANPPRAKRQRAATTHRESDSEDDMEEVDTNPLTRADISTIVDSVLSNFSKEGASSTDDS